MLDIGWSELLVIAVVLIVVVGPKDLPPMIRAFGKTMAGLRKMAGDFRSQFDEALKEADMDDVRQTISDVRNLNPTNSIRDAMNPLRQLSNDLRNDLNGVTTSSTATSAPEGAPAVDLAAPEMKLPDGPPPMTTPTAVAAAAATPATVAASPVTAMNATPVVTTPAVEPGEKPKAPRKRAEKSVQEIEAEKVAAKPKRAAKIVSTKDEAAKPARKRASAAEPGSVALSKDAPKPSTAKAAKAAVEAAAPMVELAKSMVEPSGAGASAAKPVKKAKAKKGEA
ncbi:MULTISPECIES: Sec-independent protein translocase protein TatB [unclassified Rhizobium]|uniref:Sec-independent protein translocase protein TatB n=1 Tax=unclassified Rhizobium TaxID=2613769 RepID=UPI0017877129|nr:MULTISPECIES: Sec-independent protein translocase protein TatB [unclassified Rhizobium]MBD8689042.1 twin-arginine translocase subunit TatB [Rhizobium sp. CFBP 13644]MBD8693510.1 twin-arginine translocase subunit TatB [Rhizobium sp. CFBP 13717]